MSHTPGPWKASEKQTGGPYGYTGHRIDAGGDEWGCGSLWVAEALGVHVGVPLDQIEANAHLIAAAPELMAAVDLLLETHSSGPHCENVGDWLEARRLAVIALAKARGTA